jgi:hypothetical protein
MLTAYQCEVMGAYTDGGMVCVECATELAGERVQDPEFIAALLRGESVDLGLRTFIRYELDGVQGENEDYARCGIYCDNCNAELAAPWEEEDIHDVFHYEYRVDECEYCRKELAEECEENERTSEYHEEDNDEQE